ncbi:hypothetical protein PAHAL_5G022600 [Panicum hallii]|uniref:Amino acid permease/ SLC12A domain-containing protein n=1 Tax=Panicum hallii TaxID=206008 RepID=A0A2T8IIM7_9POAL|nr:hypothetical protein PAHAL_5G022600 [Panicum hallii]
MASKYERATMEFVFTHCYTDNGVGIHSKVYALAIGLLTSQYSLLGYDTSAHMSEETKNAAWSGPMGIVVSVALSSVFGWVYLVSLTSIVTNIPILLDPSNDAGGNAIAQALHAAFRTRFGSGAGGIVCLAAMAVAIFLCGTASVTSNSRMGYAFSRDGAMPFSRFWYRVNKQEVPFNVVWLSVSVAFVMALTAMVSITTLGMYIAYGLPIFFRVTTARRSFVPGPFHLGKYGVLIGWAAVAWVALVTVLFCLPVAYPVAVDNFNYTPAAVGGVLLLSLGAWALHARFWFRAACGQLRAPGRGLRAVGGGLRAPGGGLRAPGSGHAAGGKRRAAGAGRRAAGPSFAAPPPAAGRIHHGVHASPKRASRLTILRCGRSARFAEPPRLQAACGPEEHVAIDIPAAVVTQPALVLDAAATPPP